MSLLNESIMFAMEAHAGQVRKFDGTPYIRHPLSVMGMMSEITSDEAVLAACVLHDTVEDCEDVTLEVIHERFGEIVAGYVFYVSEISHKSDGNRKTRKAIDRRHYQSGSGISHNIKVLDLIDNIPSIVMYDAVFSKIYLEEKRLLLSVLVKADPVLIDRALKIIDWMETFNLTDT